MDSTDVYLHFFVICLWNWAFVNVMYDGINDTDYVEKITTSVI